MKRLFLVILTLLSAAIFVLFQLLVGGSTLSFAAEVSFGGTYRVRTSVFNYGIGPETDAKTRRLADQRFRFSLNSKANENLKGVLAFEIGDIIWGVGAHDVGQKGGAQGADVVNIETRNAYLDFKIPNAPVNIKAGIQPPLDGFKGYLFDWDWDFDVAGIEGAIDFDKALITVGAFRLNEKDVAKSDERDLLKAGLDFSAAEGAKVSPYLYLLVDNRENKKASTSLDFWAGLSGSAKLEPVTLNSFFLVNKGKTKFKPGAKTVDNFGFCGNIEGSLPVGLATLSLQGLYSTGEENQSATNTSRGDFHVILGPNYAGYLELFLPGAEDVSGLNVDANNSGFGLLSLQARAKFEPRDDVWASVAAGYLQSAAKNSSGESQMGVEFDGVVGYKFTGGMTAELGVAYAIPGDFYKSAENPKPGNMYEIYTRLQYGF